VCFSQSFGQRRGPVDRGRALSFDLKPTLRMTHGAGNGLTVWGHLAIISPTALFIISRKTEWPGGGGDPWLLTTFSSVKF